MTSYEKKQEALLKMTAEQKLESLLQEISNLRESYRLKDDAEYSCGEDYREAEGKDRCGDDLARLLRDYTKDV